MDRKKIDLWWLNNGGGASLDADYQAVLDRATSLGYTLPSSGQQTIQNQLVLDLKSNGIWTEMDIFYSLANDGSEGFAQLNWKAPSSYQITKSGSPTWASNGYTGAASGYLITNFKPATNGVKMTQNNTGVGGYFDATRATHACFGACTSLDANNDKILMQIAAGTNNFASCNYDGVGSIVVSSGATSFYCHVRRPDASNDYGQVDSVETGRAVASGGIATDNINILANSIGSTTSTGITCRVFFAGSNSCAGATMKSLLEAYVAAL